MLRESQSVRTSDFALEIARDACVQGGWVLMIPAYYTGHRQKRSSQERMPCELLRFRMDYVFVSTLLVDGITSEVRIRFCVLGKLCFVVDRRIANLEGTGTAGRVGLDI